LRDICYPLPHVRSLFYVIITFMLAENTLNVMSEDNYSTMRMRFQFVKDELWKKFSDSEIKKLLSPKEDRVLENELGWTISTIAHRLQIIETTARVNDNSLRMLQAYFEKERIKLTPLREIAMKVVKGTTQNELDTVYRAWRGPRFYDLKRDRLFDEFLKSHNKTLIDALVEGILFQCDELEKSNLIDFQIPSEFSVRVKTVRNIPGLIEQARENIDDLILTKEIE